MKNPASSPHLPKPGNIFLNTYLTECCANLQQHENRLLNSMTYKQLEVLLRKKDVKLHFKWWLPVWVKIPVPEVFPVVKCFKCSATKPVGFICRSLHKCFLKGLHLAACIVSQCRKFPVPYLVSHSFYYRFCMAAGSRVSLL